MIVLKKIGDLIAGLFLAWAGLIIFLLYFCFNKTEEFAFIKLGLFLFMFCLGLGGIILGFRRIFIAIRDILNIIKNKKTNS
jgi:hypothetical protein